jgi:hypothetical protein
VRLADPTLLIMFECMEIAHRKSLFLIFIEVLIVPAPDSRFGEQRQLDRVVALTNNIVLEPH